MAIPFDLNELPVEDEDNQQVGDADELDEGFQVLQDADELDEDFQEPEDANELGRNGTTESSAISESSEDEMSSLATASGESEYMVTIESSESMATSRNESEERKVR
ncbi:hypothetical protein GUJ93_ZPchr0012g20195 [Zizania palustris]|uniref:Uncharacterized protein n=1 Tax=Zizania palustris TaxID=103762 RepID=A0A8J6BVR0_ZIZPA|nr:hypothetical protein GUJ93_ZPchr0012g20195 [Zizania palustris]